MQRPLAGSVELLGEDVRSRTPEWLARHLSVVLTEPIDAGALTARELVGFGRYPFTDWLGRSDRARPRAHRRRHRRRRRRGDRRAQVRSLSDGERQRVLIARALAQEPRLVVLDEPTAYLDLPRRIETLGLLRRLVRGNGVSVLLSTHHLDLALSHADRVWLLPSGAAHDRRARGRGLLRRARAHVRVGPPGVRSAATAPSACARSPRRRRWRSKAMAWRGAGSSGRCGARGWPRSSVEPAEKSEAGAAAPGRRVIARVADRRRRRARYRLEVEGDAVDCASISRADAALARARPGRTDRR